MASRKRARVCSEGEHERGFSIKSQKSSSSSSASVEIPEALLSSLTRLDKAYKDVNGYNVSREARAKLRAEGEFQKLENLTYGEISLKDFAAFLLGCGIDTKGIYKFADLGSGTGKAVLVTPMVFPQMKKSVGIEILPSLHSCAVAAKKNVSDWFETDCSVDFLCADIFKDTSWVDSDLVFVTTTCFTDEAMCKLEECLQRMKTGALVITATRRLTTPSFELKQKVRLKYAKGSLVVYLWRKKGKQASA